MKGNPPPEIRFSRKVIIRQENDCWDFDGFHDQGGYGKFRYNGRQIAASRAAYIFYIGPIPIGMCVLHVCDNPGCVNPSHLKIGTNLDNITDRNNKNRNAHPIGEKHPKAKLTDLMVKEIKMRVAFGDTHAKVAKEYMVSPACVDLIIEKRTWRHVK